MPVIEKARRVKEGMRTGRPAARSAWQRVAAVVLFGAYFGAFAATYKLAVSPLYAYEGLSDRAIPASHWLMLALLAVSPVLVMDLEFRRASAITSWLIYMSLIIPCCVVPALAMDSDPTESMWVSFSVVANFIAFEMMRARPLFRLRSLPELPSTVRVLVPAVTLALTLLVFRWNGFKIDMELGSAMYDRRAAASEIIPTEVLSAYLLATLMGAGIPFAIADGMSRRRLFPSFVGLFSIVVIVSFNGTRSMLLFPILCAIGIWVITRPRFPWLHLLGIFAALPVVSILSGSSVLLGLTLERLQCLPAQLTVIYYQFAGATPSLLLRDTSILRWIGFDNPLHQDLPHYIGSVFFSGASVNANANIWASAQVELKVAGPIIVSLLAGIILRLLDSIVAAKGTRHAKLVAAGLCSYWALTWSNSALQTSLLSNGIIAGMLLLLILPSGRRRPQVMRQRPVLNPASKSLSSELI